METLHRHDGTLEHTRPDVTRRVGMVSIVSVLTHNYSSRVILKRKKEPLNIHEALKSVRPGLGTPLAERFYVIEVRPAWTDSGYWGEKYYPPETTRVSEYFASEALAQEWMDQHEPDDGKFLKIRKDVLYERVIRTWTPTGM